MAKKISVQKAAVEPNTPKAIAKVYARRRQKGGAFIALFVLVMWVASQHYPEGASLFSGRDPAQISDLGPDIYQPLFVSLTYSPAGLLFGLFSGWVFEISLRDKAFGTWSRRGLGFIVGCLLFAAIAGAML